MYCKKCGKPLGDQDLFCKYCGEKRSSDNVDKPDLDDRIINNSVNVKRGGKVWPIVVTVVTLCVFASTALFIYLRIHQMNESNNDSENGHYLDKVEFRDSHSNTDDRSDTDRVNENGEDDYSDSITKESGKKTDDINASGAQNDEEENTNPDSNSAPADIAAEVTGVPYTGSVSYKLRYYPTEPGNVGWDMTRPDDYRVLIHVDQNDYDSDGEDEILAILFEKGSFSVEMLEKKNGSWKVEDIINFNTCAYDTASNIERSDLFVQNENGTYVIFNEEYSKAQSFADGESYIFDGWKYDGNRFVSEFQRIDTSSSSGPVQAIVDMDADSWDLEGESYRQVKNFIDDIHRRHFYPKKLGFDHPICESDGCVLLTRVRRLDDSDEWTFDLDKSLYGYVLDPDGYLGHIDLTIENNEDVDLSTLPPVDVKKIDYVKELRDEISAYDGDYIIPDSGIREIRESDLIGLDNKDLTYARNEIYARHGRVFKSSELNQYFRNKDWYEADEDFNDADISDTERKNAEIIKKYQKDNGLEYTPH